MNHGPRRLELELDPTLASRLPSDPAEARRVIEAALRRHLGADEPTADPDTIARLNDFNERHGAFGDEHSTL